MGGFATRARGQARPVDWLAFAIGFLLLFLALTTARDSRNRAGRPALGKPRSERFWHIVAAVFALFAVTNFAEAFF